MCVTLPSLWLERDSLFPRRAPDKDEGGFRDPFKQAEMTHPNRMTTGQGVDDAETLRLLCLPALAGGFFTASATWEVLVLS